MNCILKTSTEFKSLLKETNLHPFVLEVKIAKWQEVNGVDNYPTASEIVNSTNYQMPSTEGQIASEKTIRDLAARISDRIGIPVKFESDRSKKYKGKIENGVAYVNLAYATLDTPIHEILGHPIIRAIKNKNTIKQDEYSIKSFTYKGDNYRTEKDIFGYSYKNDEIIDDSEFDKITKEYLKEGELKSTPLYQNLLKELETGRGKEVLDRIKIDYNIKGYKNDGIFHTTINGKKYTIVENAGDTDKGDFLVQEDLNDDDNTYIGNYNFEDLTQFGLNLNHARNTYTLEEQQEEAIVELLGLMTAEKLDAVKDGKIISLLKRLLKEMKVFMRSLLRQREVEIDSLPDNMTIGDIADLLAYSNSKLILPGYEVEYTTPDNMKFKTYQEASNHISELAKSVKDVDLSSVDLSKTNLKDISYFENSHYNEEYDVLVHGKFKKENNQWFVSWDDAVFEPIKEEYVLRNFRETSGQGLIENFIEKNKEYEQSKEIIEEWKKVNNIQYNPEEIYSRGQEFSSVVGAYSSFDVNLMMQNLLQHIEDNEKAGGKFAISAYTKPIDKQIGHLEGGGGKIKFKLYPQSNDILWAANTDVYSGSVWDASEKVNKDKKSELLGVSYTKYPSLNNVNTVQPNLASIVDDLAHHHNELGIALTGNNFRLEYDENIPYQTKKIIDGINKILDQKYGKLIKPEQKTTFKWNVFQETSDEGDTAFKDRYRGFVAEFDTEQEANNFVKNKGDLYWVKRGRSIGLNPTQTNANLKESIESVKSKVVKYKEGSLTPKEEFTEISEKEYNEAVKKGKKGFVLGTTSFGYSETYDYNGYIYTQIDYNKETSVDTYGKIKKESKEYTSQALINTKIAALKEVAKKQPRSLIRSEVTKINTSSSSELYDQFGDELPFQKIPSKSTNEVFFQKTPIQQFKSKVTKAEKKEVNKKLNEDLKLFLNSYGISVNYVDGLDKLGYDAVAIADITNKLILISKGEESWDTLPEEAAHFAFELLGESNPLYIRLMDIIESTDIYKQTFEEYSEDPEYQKNGKPDISKLKKEAIGKAITRNLVDSVSESRGFKATLKLILEKIKSIFGKINRAEFNKEVDKLTLGIAKSMKDGTFKGDVANLAISKAGILKSIKAVSKEEDSLKTAVKALETRLTMSKRTATPLEDVDKLNADIIQIKDMIEDRKAQAGLTIYINNILSELESMIDIIDAYKDEETRESVYLDNKKIKDVSEFLDTHKVAMKKIALLEFDSSFIQRSPDTLEAIKLTNNLMGEIERFFDSVLKERTIEIAEKLKHERSDLDVESALFEATKVDSGWLNLFLGKASNNKDELIRMVKNLLTKIKNRVERYTLDVGKVLLDKQLALEATGFKDFGKFYERDKNGNKTGYIISQYNIGEYQAAKKAYYEALKTRLGVESLDMDKMSTAQKSEFSKALNLWRTEHTQEDPITKKAMPGRRYLNPVYASMDKFQKEYYDALLRRQRDNLSKLPKRYRNDYSEFQLPALRKSVLQRLRSSEQSMWQNFKAIKDETLNVQEEDTQFGTREVYHNELTGDPIKFIPVHYTNMLENPNDLSDDLTGLYVAFTHMAESFQQKSANADKIWMIQKAINERPYIGAKQTKSGSATNIAKMLQNIIDADFYEIQVNKNKYTKKIDSVINYVRRNNLLFNVFTHVANYTVGSVYSKIEDISGKYSTNASKLWAEKTLDGNALGIMADMGARKKLNKVSLLMEHNNVIKDTKRIFSGLNIKNKAGRMLADSGLWATYELADYRIKAKIMLSVYDNYRYFDNKFINRQEYNILNKDKSATEISQGWNSLKDSSLWNMYEAVDGKLVIKPEVNENTKNMIKGIVKQISDQVDGKLSEHDKPELYRHEIGRAILLHRGWLLQGAEARWKSNKLNYETGQYEEGYHRTFVKFMARATGIGANKMGNNINTYGQTIEYEKNLFTGAIKEAFKNMTPEEKSNVAKATADMMFIFLAIIVAGMLKDLGDEDENKDDYTIQFMAYMGQRFKLELTAFSNPFEVFAILSSPSAGLNQIESIFDFVSTIVSFDEEGNWKFTKPGKSGAYTGVPAYEKFIIKRSILKPFYEASSAEAIKSKRTYLENMIMN